jgi:hypothetical protein
MVKPFHFFEQIIVTPTSSKGHYCDNHIQDLQNKRNTISNATIASIIVKLDSINIELNKNIILQLFPH